MLQPISKLLEPLSIQNHSILFLIIIRSNVFKLVKTNSVLDFLKNNTSLTSTWRVLFWIESKASCFNYYLIWRRFSTEGNAYQRCWVLIEDEGLSYFNAGVFDSQQVRDVQACNKHNHPMTFYW